MYMAISSTVTLLHLKLMSTITCPHMLQIESNVSFNVILMIFYRSYLLLFQRDCDKTPQIFEFAFVNEYSVSP